MAKIRSTYVLKYVGLTAYREGTAITTTRSLVMGFIDVDSHEWSHL